MKEARSIWKREKSMIIQKCNIADELQGVVTGWYFSVGRREFFVITDQKKKTDKLATKVLKDLKVPVNADTIADIRYRMMAAKCELKSAKALPGLGGEPYYYYNIFGTGFSGYGTNVNDGYTTLIKLED